MRLVLAGAVAVVVVGCAGPKHYGVRFNLAEQRLIEAAPIAPAADAREVVKTAVTVAFNPPDACRDVKAAGAGASEVSNVMRLSCGVLMTELESAAAREGFQVVSWQTLRGTAPAISYAKENKVDILFEINDLSFDIPVQDLYTFTDVSFFETDHQGRNPQPLVVGDAMGTARRCQEQFWKTFDPSATVTIDVKMVTVADGRVRWTFRDTRRERADERLQVTRTWQANPSSTSTLTGMGFGFAIAGGVFILVPLLDPSDPELNRTFQTIGAVGLVGGLVLGVVGLVLPREYPVPESLLCAGPSLEDAQRTPLAPVPGPATSVTFSEQRKLQTGDVEIRRKKLMNEVIQSFMSALAEMRR